MNFIVLDFDSVKLRDLIINWTLHNQIFRYMAIRLKPQDLKNKEFNVMCMCVKNYNIKSYIFNYFMYLILHSLFNFNEFKTLQKLL